jgi:hypothetical protein
LRLVRWRKAYVPPFAGQNAAASDDRHPQPGAGAEHQFHALLVWLACLQEARLL